MINIRMRTFTSSLVDFLTFFFFSQLFSALPAPLLLCLIRKSMEKSSVEVGREKSNSPDTPWIFRFHFNFSTQKDCLSSLFTAMSMLKKLALTTMMMAQSMPRGSEIFFLHLYRFHIFGSHWTPSSAAIDGAEDDDDWEKFCRFPEKRKTERNFVHVKETWGCVTRRIRRRKRTSKKKMRNFSGKSISSMNIERNENTQREDEVKATLAKIEFGFVLLIFFLSFGLFNITSHFLINLRFFSQFCVI